MKTADLQSRKEKILEIIVETYVAEKKPVGSRSIARKLRFKFSPATIRNIMADLEEAGYITHPYTSAGRIPTDRGYRYYVDNIMPVQQLTPQEKKEIARQLAATEKELSAIMEKTSQLLSEFSEEAGVVVYPCMGKSRLRHLELVDMGNNSVLLVLLTNSGLVKNFILDFPSGFSRGHLEKISNLFNSQLEGAYLNEMRNYLLQKKLSDDFSFFNIFRDAFSVFEDAFRRIDEERLCFEGTAQIISQPEFRDQNALNRILRLIEERKPLLEIMGRDMAEDGIKIHIGAENPSDEIRFLTLITANYHIAGEVMGNLGVIGPTRMAYSRVISIVQHIASALEEVLAERVF